MKSDVLPQFILSFTSDWTKYFDSTMPIEADRTPTPPWSYRVKALYSRCRRRNYNVRVVFRDTLVRQCSAQDTTLYIRMQIKVMIILSSVELTVLPALSSREKTECLIWKFDICWRVVGTCSTVTNISRLSAAPVVSCRVIWSLNIAFASPRRVSQWDCGYYFCFNWPVSSDPIKLLRISVR